MAASILIARIRKPHGVKGEVSCDSFTFDNSRFARLKYVTVRGKEDKILTVEKVREAQKGLIIKFEGIDDRNAAELLKDHDILIDESERIPLPDDEAYIDELIGMDAVDAESGKTVGTVKDVYEFPTGNLIALDLPEGRERLLPRYSEEFVRIEKSKKRILVRLLEEL